jgi:broad specificity phosphatase PhoE
MTATREPARLLLVRHGETEWNVARRFQGQLDSPLTERGRWQVGRLVERLRPLPLAAVYASDLERTLATARPLAESHGLPTRPARAFREGAFGEYEGFTFAELVDRHGDAVRRWAADPIDLAPPGGETLRQLQDRVAALVRELVERHAGETVLLVGHGGSVRAAVMEILRLDLVRFRSLRMDNASLTVIQSDNDFDALMLFNDISHLETMSP